MMKQIPTAVLFLLLTLTSFGQVNYAGKVTNTAHEPIEGATLVLKNKNVHTTTTTRANGIFQFAGITPGEYQLSILSLIHI